MSDNIYGNVSTSQLLSPVNSTSTKTSSSADTRGFNDNVVIVNIGVALDSLSGSRYWTIQLEESANNSTFTSVADSDTGNGAASFVLNSSITDDQAYVMNYTGSKRYIRVVITATGSHSIGTPMGVTAILGKPAHAPVA